MKAESKIKIKNCYTLKNAKKICIKEKIDVYMC